MKLSFRGAQYEHQPTEQKFIEGEVGGMYRGTPWKIHKYQQSSRHRQYSQEMIYRGVRYQKG